jgi:hypothetical protein
MENQPLILAYIQLSKKASLFATTVIPTRICGLPHADLRSAPRGFAVSTTRICGQHHEEFGMFPGENKLSLSLLDPKGN